MSKEPVAFMKRAEVEIMLKKEKEMASASTFGLDIKPPYPVEIEAKVILLDTSSHNSRSLMEEKGICVRACCVFPCFCMFFLREFSSVSQINCYPKW